MRTRGWEWSLLALLGGPGVLPGGLFHLDEHLKARTVVLHTGEEDSSRAPAAAAALQLTHTRMLRSSSRPCVKTQFYWKL